MSLRALTLAFALAFLIATIATGMAIHSASHATIVRLVDRRLANVSATVLEGPPTRAAILERIATFARERDTGDIGFVLSDPAGTRVGGNVEIRRLPPPGYSTLAVDDRIVGLTEGRALVRPAGAGLTLTTIAETEPVADYNAARTRIFLTGFGSIALVVLGGVAAFALTVSRRIAEMRRTVDAIIDGDMARRVPVPRSGGAFAAQASAFNRMLDRLAASMEAIRHVSHDIAHDLRTPLARLRSQLALLRRRSPEGESADGLDAAIAQTDSVLALFAATLRIAEVEGADRRQGFAPVDLGVLVADVGAMMAPVAAEAGVRIDVVAVPATIEGDRRLLVQALVNLIENALHHADGATRIALSVEPTRDAVRVIVADDGPGIPPADHALALRRFGRVDRSRQRPGHGLGLPLAVAVAGLHRGTLALEEAAPGLRVVVTLPTGA